MSDGRILVSEQCGNLRAIVGGTLLINPVLYMKVDCSGERGLLGIEEDPNFSTNHYIYLYHTVPGGVQVHNRISRFVLNGNVAVTNSEVVIFELDPLSTATNHNGGALHFGPDGFLYIATGDNAHPANSQSLSTVLGKILRISANGIIPTNNPFYNTVLGKNKAIWALGLRNPFTFSTNPVTSQFIINDVGLNLYEEVNIGFSGFNYGWPTCEGLCPVTNRNFTDPYYKYIHVKGAECAITGGTHYNPIRSSSLPSKYIGKYFFMDYCAGWIKYIDPMLPTRSIVTAEVFATGLVYPVDIRVDNSGRLIYVQRGTSTTGGGSVWSIEGASAVPPTLAIDVKDAIASSGSTWTFKLLVYGTAPLLYQWYSSGIPISGATKSSYTTPTLSVQYHNGTTYNCVTTGFRGQFVSSRLARLTVTDRQPPVAAITHPSADLKYGLSDASRLLVFNATAIDSTGTVLPPSAFTWLIQFHHNAHMHPVLSSTPGITFGSLSIPRIGEQSTNVFYRISLTVTDKIGLSTTVTRDISPEIASMTVTSTIGGGTVTVDGVPNPLPFTRSYVVGNQVELGASSPQFLFGVNRFFGSWSDGGSQTHLVTVPAATITTILLNFALTSLPTTSPSIVPSRPTARPTTSMPRSIRTTVVPVPWTMKPNSNSPLSRSPTLAPQTLFPNTVRPASQRPSIGPSKSPFTRQPSRRPVTVSSGPSGRPHMKPSTSYRTV